MAAAIKSADDSGPYWSCVVLEESGGVLGFAKRCVMSIGNPTVFVLDDDVSVREALKLLIESAGWQAATFGSAREFLSQAQAASVPSCLVLDLLLPDLHGLDVQELLADRTDMPIIFVSGQGDVPSTVRAMKAGAVEFLTKPLHGDLLLSAIRSALDSSTAAAKRAAEIRHLQDRSASLSRREREVMALVVRGLLNKQVAGELGISEITVKAHRGRVMRKMEARSLPELVRMAVSLCVTPQRAEPVRIESRRALAGLAPSLADAGFGFRLPGATAA